VTSADPPFNVSRAEAESWTPSIQHADHMRAEEAQVAQIIAKWADTLLPAEGGKALLKQAVLTKAANRRLRWITS
jgi:hypothetical protein